MCKYINFFQASSGNVAIEAGLRELKTEQDSLRTRLTDLALANAATDFGQPVDPAAIEQLRLRLEGLETDLPSLRLIDLYLFISLSKSIKSFKGTATNVAKR